MPYVTEDYIFIRVLLFCFTVLSGLGCLVLSPRETHNSRTPLPGARSTRSLRALYSRAVILLIDTMAGQSIDFMAHWTIETSLVSEAESKY